MIRINLLPHRAVRREQRKREYTGNLVATALLGGAVVFAGGFVIDRQIGTQDARNEYIAEAIKKQDIEIGEIKNLEGAIASLRARQQAVENLQSDRTVPVHLFDELTRLVPAGVHLEKLQQADLTVTLSGLAQSNERVAELLRNLSERSDWVAKPQLEEIKELVTAEQPASGQSTPAEQRRAYEFKLNVLVQRRDPADARPGTVPAGAAAWPGNSPAAAAASAQSLAAAGRTGTAGSGQ